MLKELKSNVVEEIGGTWLLEGNSFPGPEKLVLSLREELMDYEREVVSMLKVMEKFRRLRNSENIFSFPPATVKIPKTIYA